MKSAWEVKYLIFSEAAQQNPILSVQDISQDVVKSKEWVGIPVGIDAFPAYACVHSVCICQVPKIAQVSMGLVQVFYGRNEFFLAP